MIDAVLMDRNKELEDFGKRLGFSKILFNEDIKSLNIVKAKSDEFNRKALSTRKTDILLNPHLNRQDKLERNSGLNNVLCKLANKNEVFIGFSLHYIKDEGDLGRIMQAIVLCRKYKVGIVFFTLAKNKYEMRGCQDLLAYLRVIGFGPGETNNALNNIEKVFEKKTYMKKGLRILKDE